MVPSLRIVEKAGAASGRASTSASGAGSTTDRFTRRLGTVPFSGALAATTCANAPPVWGARQSECAPTWRTPDPRELWPNRSTRVGLRVLGRETGWERRPAVVGRAERSGARPTTAEVEAVRIPGPRRNEKAALRGRPRDRRHQPRHSIRPGRPESLPKSQAGNAESVPSTG